MRFIIIHNTIDLSTLSTQDIKDEILWAREALWKTAGREIPQNLLRPPGGAFNNRTIQVAATRLWNINVGSDFRRNKQVCHSKQNRKRVENGIHNGAIVLQHPKPYDTAAFPNVLDNVLYKGYNVVPVAKGLR
jgi:peptidoglycan/xylan/chitin deacetylase (PgdA/CDA1 family)